MDEFETDEYVAELEQAVLDLQDEKDALIEALRIAISGECWDEVDDGDCDDCDAWDEDDEYED